jgi:acetyltransferase-like isoleucine patch superfamily enzyme
VTRHRSRLGEDCVLDEPENVGYLHEEGADPATIGDRARIRKGTIVYAGVEIGDDLTTGHNALIREGTTIGDGVVVGTDTVIDGRTTIGSHVSLQTGVYVPTDTAIGDNVFVGPRAVMTNDPYPVRQDVDLAGPTLADGVSVGANATVLPGVRIGEGSFVAAGATVTEDVPAETLALGSPARHRELPEELAGVNTLHE